MDKETIDLKPCPFCGGEAKIIEEHDIMIGETFYFCECVDCTATILGGKVEEKEAIKMWNRRVDENI